MYNTKYAPDINEEIKRLSSNLALREGKPQFITVQNAICLPRKLNISGNNKPYQGIGGVINQNGEFVKESCVFDLPLMHSNLDRLAFGGAYKVEGNYIKKNKIAVYLGFANNQWGHFLIDVIQRCYILDEFLNYKKNNLEFIFAGSTDGSSFNENELEIFELIGLSRSKIHIVTVPTEYDSIIVPLPALYPGKYVYKCYSEMINNIIRKVMNVPNNRNRDTYDKIYFSRSHLKNRNEIGENVVENYFSTAGYKILYPEELSTFDQIFYWQTASEIASVEGSISHNIIFSGEHTNVYIICKMRKKYGYQFTLDLVTNKASIYIEAYKEPFKKFPLNISRGPFWLYPTNNLKAFFSDMYNIDIYSYTKKTDFLRYTKLCIVAFLKSNFSGSRYYLKNIIFKKRKY